MRDNIMAKRLILVLYLLALGFSVPACTPDITLVTLGDSLTAGDGDERGVGYPVRVQEMMQTAGHIVSLDNLGLSGWTSGDLVSIETWEEGAGPFYEAQSILSQAVAEGRTPVVCLWIGSNDAFGLYSWVCDEYPTECEANNLREFEENMNTLLSRLIATGAMVFVALIDDQSKRPMFGPGGEGFEGISPDELDNMSAQIAAYNQIITTLAGQYNAHLVDFYNRTIFETPELISDDGNHPNADGYDEIAQVWWTAISPFVSNGGTELALNMKSAPSATMCDLAAGY